MSYPFTTIPLERFYYDEEEGKIKRFILFEGSIYKFVREKELLLKELNIKLNYAWKKKVDGL